MRSKKHIDLVENYNDTKRKYLESIATQMLKNDEKLRKLKQLNININVLNLF